MSGRLSWLLLMLVACSDSTLDTASETIQLVPAAIDLGTVMVGSSSERSLLIRNRGRGPVGLEIVELPEGLRLEPEVHHLGPGEQRSITIHFEASAVGEGGGTLLWKLTGGQRLGLPIRAEVSSRPFALDRALDFGELIVGEIRVADLELRSLVDHPLEISLPPPDHEELEWGLDALELSPRSVQRLPLRYAPVARGVLEEELSLTGCDICEPAVVRVQGRAIGWELLMEPRGVDFGIVPVGIPVSRAIRLENVGELPLDLELDASLVRRPFATTAESSYFLETGDEANFEVRFRPTEGGLRGAPLRLRDRGSGLDHEIRLLGTGGSRLEAIPPTLDFGPVPEGFTRREVVHLQNVGLRREVELRSISFGLASAAFRVVDRKVGTIIGSDPLPIEVEYQPLQGVGDRAELVVRTSDETQELRIPLRGESGPLPFEEACELAAVPQAIRAGMIPTRTPRSYRILLVNEGAGPCLIREVGWAGPIPLEMALEPFAPFMLGPGEAITAELAMLFVHEDGEVIHRRGGRIGIWSSGEEEPALEIACSAIFGVELPTASPHQLFFETVEIGSEARLSFHITEPYDLHISSSVSLHEGSSEDFSLVEEGMPPPFTPLDGLEIELRFTPTSAGYHHGLVEVRFDGAAEPLRIDLIGLGLDPDHG